MQLTNSRSVAFSPAHATPLASASSLEENNKKKSLEYYKQKEKEKTPATRSSF